MTRLLFLMFLLFVGACLESVQVTVGIDCFLTKEHENVLRGKRIGLVTNHTAINQDLKTTLELMKAQSCSWNYTIGAIFTPEHGLNGAQYASEAIPNSKDEDGIVIYSLHGTVRRPTKKMLEGLELLVYDIQDIGSRSYTYMSTLFYLMEEAAKRNIPVVVLDRPNPINGLTVDGPVLENKWQSFVGYLNIPYCHGMTTGELALYFNKEYNVNCALTVVPMKGWKRSMTFADTGLKWIPTSPYIPEASTAFYYPIGILGELHVVNIGIGYTLPFKIVGAPWINAVLFAQRLNDQHCPGVHFHPYYYRPFYGKFAGQDCQGALVMITNSTLYLPVTTPYLMMGILKSLYPKEFKKALDANANKQDMFNKINGTDEVYRLLKDEQYATWKLKNFHRQERVNFMNRRRPYLIPEYK